VYIVERSNVWMILPQQETRLCYELKIFLLLRFLVEPLIWVRDSQIYCMSTLDNRKPEFCERTTYNHTRTVWFDHVFGLRKALCTFSDIQLCSYVTTIFDFRLRLKIKKERKQPPSWIMDRNQMPKLVRWVPNDASLVSIVWEVLF